MSIETIEQLSLLENEEQEVVEVENTLAAEEDFKELVYSRMRSIHNEGMIVGFQTACHAALGKIDTFERSVGKKSTNDYKRCLKDLKNFFETGISRNVNSAESVDETENVEAETAQN